MTYTNCHLDLFVFQTNSQLTRKDTAWLWSAWFKKVQASLCSVQKSAAKIIDTKMLVVFHLIFRLSKIINPTQRRVFICMKILQPMICYFNGPGFKIYLLQYILTMWHVIASIIRLWCMKMTPFHMNQIYMRIYKILSGIYLLAKRAF